MKLHIAANLFCSAAILVSLPHPALAQGPIDFGNDASEWNNDGECDDARFIGGGMSISLITDHIGRDASDCRKAHAEERIVLNPLFVEPTGIESIDYGDNASEFAFDGACDDIRFTGAYAADMIYLVEDIGHDADDCRAAVSAGEAQWQGATVTPNHGITVDALLNEEADDTPGTI